MKTDEDWRYIIAWIVFGLVLICAIIMICYPKVT